MSWSRIRERSDALATSLINLLTSLLSGFVVFSVLGYMALRKGKTVESFKDYGIGLIFMVYPEVSNYAGRALAAPINN